MPERLVLDTNVWLDLYLFGDGRGARLAQALQTGALLALRSARTDAEIDVVTRRPLLAARADPAALQAARAAWSMSGLLLEPAAPAPFTCRDVDDQKFLDLALAGGARWLFTRDRQLLRLAGAARRHCLAILVPEAWADPGPANPPHN
jgi:putative PIN family toxin of toxin-antitoxin system